MADIGKYADPQAIDAVNQQIDQGIDVYNTRMAQRRQEVNSLRQQYQLSVQQGLSNHQERMALKQQWYDAVDKMMNPPSDPGDTSTNSGVDATSGSGPSMDDATQAAKNAGAPNSVLERAKKMLGNQDYIGFCEKFVENMQGKSGMFPSALAAAQSGPLSTDWKNIKPGDEVYFGSAQENGGYGHVGIYSGNAKIVSATSHGVLDLPIADFNAPVLGFRPLKQQSAPVSTQGSQLQTPIDGSDDQESLDAAA